MKYLIFTLSLLAFVSCKDNKTEERDSKTETNEKSVKSTSDHHDHDVKNDHHDHEATTLHTNAWMNEIKLNSGNKWQANIETNEGVERMKKVLTHKKQTL